jgi:hypothetical protein
MNHDQMYTHPEVFHEAVIYFIENKQFGPHFENIGPVANPFIKHKP